jgi:hypothetical protein
VAVGDWPRTGKREGARKDFILKHYLLRKL